MLDFSERYKEARASGRAWQLDELLSRPPFDTVSRAMSEIRTLGLTPSADLVQEMYLRELKNFKPTPIKASDSEGNVQKFAMPSAPKSPEEASIQDQLQAYETQTVEVEGQSTGSEAAPAEQDWFMEEEEDEGAPAHH